MPMPGLHLLRLLHDEEEEAETSFNVDDNAALGFVLVLCAGLSTGIGAAAVFYKRLVALASKRVLAAGIGVSAGVMLYVSFIEIMVKSVESFTDDGLSESDAYLCGTICFFCGILFMKLLGLIVQRLDSSHKCSCDMPPSLEQGDKAHLDISVQEGGPDRNNAGPSQEAPPAAAQAQHPQGGDVVGADDSDAKLQRMGMNTALAIGLHNFPEGLATFVGTLADPAVGVTLAVAIAIHNIPEGLCVALPIYYAQGNRIKAFLWALLSGLSEPVGALVGYAIVKASGDDMQLQIYGILFGLVAGMMVAIVLIELLPTAHRYDPEDTVVNNSAFLGMVIMALSLVLFMY